jgi:PBP1b-binding outer membrane lipoprotein LpoB
MKSLIVVLISLLCLSGCYTLFPEHMAPKEAEELKRQQDIMHRSKQIADSIALNLKRRPQLIVRKWKGDFVKTQPISLSEKIHCDTLDIRANGSYRLIIESKEQSEGKWRLSI